MSIISIQLEEATLQSSMHMDEFLPFLESLYKMMEDIYAKSQEFSVYIKQNGSILSLCSYQGPRYT
jgi:hypothetical protein